MHVRLHNWYPWPYAAAKNLSIDIEEPALVMHHSLAAYVTIMYPEAGGPLFCVYGCVAKPDWLMQDATGVECLVELELLYQPLVHPR